MPGAVAALERASKAAVAASAALLVALLLAAHPDLTPSLQAAGVAAAVLSFAASGRHADLTVAVWVGLAPIFPALLHGLTGREGPVLDLIWMAGLTGSLLRLSPWTRWRLPLAWRLPLGAWALTLALVWPVLLAREVDFNLAGLTDYNAINSAAGLPAPYAASWMLFVVLTAVLGLLWLDCLIDRADTAAGAHPARHALWIGATVASVVAVVQGAVDIDFLSTPAWASLRRATGTMLDANAYGTTAAIAGPAALAILWNGDRPWHRPAAVAVLAINWAGLWMSGSRTALLCGLAGAAGVALGLRPRSPRLSVKIAAGAVLVVALVGAMVWSSDAIGPLARLRETPLTRAGLRSLWDRGGYGVIAMQMVRQYPWTGVGVGTFHVLASDYWRAISDLALPFDNAQNWWRHQLAELGVPAVLAIFAWSVVLLRDLTRRGADAGRLQRRIAAALLVGIGLSSLLGVPTQNPVVLLWFGTLCAVVAAGRPADAATAPRWTGVASAVAIAVAVLHAGGHTLLARGELSPASRAQRGGRDYVVGAWAAEPIADFDEFRWTGRRAHFVLRRNGPWLATRVWLAHPHIDRAPVHVTMSTPCQVLVDETRSTAEPIDLGLRLPDGLDSVNLTVRVSRTWSPAESGSQDRRQLGAGVALDFRPDRAALPARATVVEIQACS